MARIFNIYFHFEDLLHNATVSVRSTPFYTEYTLNNCNEQLLGLLPGNKIISKGPDHFVFPYVDDESSSELMNAILRAVADHVKVKKAGSI